MAAESSELGPLYRGNRVDVHLGVKWYVQLVSTNSAHPNFLYTLSKHTHL